MITKLKLIKPKITKYTSIFMSLYYFSPFLSKSKRLSQRAICSPSTNTHHRFEVMRESGYGMLARKILRGTSKNI